ncbi:FAD-dependent monooxygenase [Streptomyces albireticuli]|uniref:FAD-binding domain-containing protein n=1 Tax=Streptomyces albireticuli TaxID=1940 RepID=A0A2A2DGL0_9ACTN|nr:FAD-dependent monooxygenase [Streptomyces albireticuli]MCD9143682.1 FAD-dependent monooxygenase [Streptomyces albireticuli]MCD9161887.1 FAD-dependent monooxygenase [Streptomyces albireticuli]MCD9191799.1 FAD-dependent monooxygenase [Streptomyces albireticuli]PAU50450.1 hypothetical protein CK936_02475 [Streptomyces albireticuli]
MPEAAAPVLVVGAGPVGLVVACELLQQGVPVRVVDANRNHSLHSRAISVWPRVLEVLRRIDVADTLVERGHRVSGVGYYSSGRLLGTARLDRLPDTPYPFGLMLAQSRTEEVLEKRLAELGGTVERGVRLTGLAQRPDHCAVTLEHEDGATEETEVPWLVGADGAHSTTRKLLGIPFEGDQPDVSFAIADAHVDGDLSDRLLGYCYSPGGSLALGPLGDGVFRLAVSVPHPEDDTPPPLALFQEVLDARAPGHGVVRGLKWSTTFRVRVRTAARFSAGRCFLAGDAAHVMSPAGGQGMNTGLQDAVNLGWKLAGVARGRLDPAALDSYDAERREAAHRVTATTGRQTRWGFASRRAQIAARDLTLRGADRAGLVQRALAPIVAQTDTHYGPAPTPTELASELARGTGARPGVRVPVLLGAVGVAGSATEAGAGDGEGASLDRDFTSEVLPDSRFTDGGWVAAERDAFTVLLRWDPADSAERRSEAYARMRAGAPPETRWTDLSAAPDGVLTRLLGPGPVAAVVRPDGHLFRRVRPEEVPAALRAARALRHF